MHFIFTENMNITHISVIYQLSHIHLIKIIQKSVGGGTNDTLSPIFRKVQGEACPNAPHSPAMNMLTTASVTACVTQQQTLWYTETAGAVLSCLWSSSQL